MMKAHIPTISLTNKKKIIIVVMSYVPLSNHFLSICEFP